MINSLPPIVQEKKIRSRMPLTNELRNILGKRSVSHVGYSISKQIFKVYRAAKDCVTIRIKKGMKEVVDEIVYF